MYDCPFFGIQKGLHKYFRYINISYLKKRGHTASTWMQWLQTGQSAAATVSAVAKHMSHLMAPRIPLVGVPAHILVYRRMHNCQGWRLQLPQSRLLLVLTIGCWGCSGSSSACLQARANVKESSPELLMCLFESLDHFLLVRTSWLTTGIDKLGLTLQALMRRVCLWRLVVAMCS